MSQQVYRATADLKGFSWKNCASMPIPNRVLMCPPEYYDVRDERDSFAAENGGRANPSLARGQWAQIHDAYEACGLEVALIPAVAGLGEMVFCANQTLVGLTLKMERVCVQASMRYPLRRREIAAFVAWFKNEGYRVVTLKDGGLTFEGAADAIWHPGKRLLWGGCGFHSDAGVYEEVARAFAVPVVLLKLVNERLPHLDCCFCPLTHEAVLIYPSAFAADSLELIFQLFPVIIVASEPEAVRQLACNAVVVGGRTALIQRGAGGVARHVAALGLEVVEVDASEFIKAGGGIRALTMFLY